MVWTAAVISLLLQAAGPWASYPGETLGYSFDGQSGVVYTILLKNVHRQRDGVSAWMEGDHSHDKTVPYRRSLEKLWFSCDGYVTITAASHYDANGKAVDSWDGINQHVAIRPDTIYEAFAEKLCNEN